MGEAAEIRGWEEGETPKVVRLARKVRCTKVVRVEKEIQGFHYRLSLRCREGAMMYKKSERQGCRDEKFHSGDLY